MRGSPRRGRAAACDLFFVAHQPPRLVAPHPLVRSRLRLLSIGFWLRGPLFAGMRCPPRLHQTRRHHHDRYPVHPALRQHRCPFGFRSGLAQAWLRAAERTRSLISLNGIRSHLAHQISAKSPHSICYSRNRETKQPHPISPKATVTVAFLRLWVPHLPCRDMGWNKRAGFLLPITPLTRRI